MTRPRVTEVEERRTCRLKRVRAFHEFCNLLRPTPCRLPTHLRPHRDAGLDDRMNRGGISIELHDRRAAVVNQRACRVNDIANAARNIAADDCVRRAPIHRPADDEHLVERDVFFGSVTPHVDADGITDETISTPARSAMRAIG